MKVTNHLKIKIPYCECDYIPPNYITLLLTGMFRNLARYGTINSSPSP